MNGAAAFAQEVAIRFLGDAQPQKVARAVAVFTFESGGLHAEKFGDADQVGVGEIDEAFLLAASGASGLAFESQTLHGNKLSGFDYRLSTRPQFSGAVCSEEDGRRSGHHHLRSWFAH